MESVRDPSNTSALDYWIDAEMADQLGHQTFSCQSWFFKLCNNWFFFIADLLPKLIADENDFDIDQIQFDTKVTKIEYHDNHYLVWTSKGIEVFDFVFFTGSLGLV